MISSFNPILYGSAGFFIHVVDSLTSTTHNINIPIDLFIRFVHSNCPTSFILPPQNDHISVVRPNAIVVPTRKISEEQFNIDMDKFFSSSRSPADTALLLDSPHFLAYAVQFVELLLQRYMHEKDCSVSTVWQAFLDNMCTNCTPDISSDTGEHVPCRGTVRADTALLNQSVKRTEPRTPNSIWQVLAFAFEDTQQTRRLLQVKRGDSDEVKWELVDNEMLSSAYHEIGAFLNLCPGLKCRFKDYYKIVNIPKQSITQQPSRVTTPSAVVNTVTTMSKSDKRKTTSTIVSGGSNKNKRPRAIKRRILTKRVPESVKSDSDSSDSDSDEDSVFEVEKLIAKGICEDTGNIRYLVRWKNFSEDDDTWESEEGLKETMTDIMFKSFQNTKGIAISWDEESEKWCEVKKKNAR